MVKFLILFLYSILFSSEHWDGVLAIVNNKAILRSDVLEQTMMLARQKKIDPQKTPLAFENLFYKTLENQIDRFVVLSAAEKDTLIEVSAKEVSQSLNQRIDAFVASFDSQKAFEDTMQTTVKEMKQEYRQNIRDELFVEKFKYSFFQDISVGKKEVVDFFSNNPDSFPVSPTTGSFSLIQTPVETSQQTIDSLFSFARSLKAKIENKKISFSEAAKQFSDFPSAKQDGGDLGEIKKGSFIPKYEKTAFSLSINEISEPFQTHLGIHLIQLIDKVGEKFHTKQILFNLDPKEVDLKQTITAFKNIQKEFYFDPGAFDSVAVDYYNKYNNFSGNYNSIEYNKLPAGLSQKISLLSEYSYSDVFVLDKQVYLIYKYDEVVSRPISIDVDWILIEKIVLENKKTHLFKNWLKEKKERMYIKINSF